MLLRWMIGIGLAFSLTLVVILGYQNRSLRSRYATLVSRNAELRPGQFVPAFRTRLSSGDSIDIAGARGPNRQVLYLFTWTCPYCRESLPAVNALAERLRNADSSRVRLLGVSLDSLARADDPRLALYQFPIIRFPERRYQRLYRASRVPALMVVSEEGRVLYSQYGVVKRELVDSLAKAVLQDVDSVSAPGSGASPRKARM